MSASCDTVSTVNDLKTTMNVPEAITAHDNWLAMRRSPGTRAKYGQHLRALEDYAGNQPLADLTAQELEFDFLGPWSQGKTPATIRNRIAALRSLYIFAEKFDFVERNPMNRIDAPQRDDRIGTWLRHDEVIALTDAVLTPIERVVIYLLLHTGLRVSEACGLEWRDLDLEGLTLTVRKSKTPSGRRTIPIPDYLVPHLRQWKEWREAKTFVLETAKGTPMAPQFVWRIVKRVGERAGIEGLHPHSLRRTYGSTLINNELRLEVVSKLLGHSSTTITEKSYAQLLDSTIAAEARQVWSANGE